jgi:hypothetical protein
MFKARNLELVAENNKLRSELEGSRQSTLLLQTNTELPAIAAPTGLPLTAVPDVEVVSAVGVGIAPASEKSRAIDFGAYLVSMPTLPGVANMAPQVAKTVDPSVPCLYVP